MDLTKPTNKTEKFHIKNGKSYGTLKDNFRSEWFRGPKSTRICESSGRSRGLSRLTPVQSTTHVRVEVTSETIRIHVVSVLIS